MNNWIAAPLLAMTMALAAPSHADSSAAQERVKQIFPGAKIKQAAGGLFEVETKVFVSQDARVVLIGGRAVDSNVVMGGMPPGPNLAAAPAPAPAAAPTPAPAQKIDFKSLPLDSAIKIVKGDGSRTVAVFTDVDCPYCKRLESTLAEIDNVTIYNFLMPLEQLHPDAKRKSESIWCANDRAAAWREFWESGKVPQSDPCDTPLAKVAALAAQNGIRGTPTMIRSDGTVMPGAAPRAMLDSWLSGK